MELTAPFWFHYPHLKETGEKNYDERTRIVWQHGF